MKKEEVISRLKAGEQIRWHTWDGTHYRFCTAGTVNARTVEHLIKDGLVIKLTSRHAPLTGSVRATEKLLHEEFK